MFRVDIENDFKKNLGTLGALWGHFGGTLGVLWGYFGGTLDPKK